MKYFFDTEFQENGETIDLISIGIVAEDGREYYAINDDFYFGGASDWIKQNVLAHFPPVKTIDVLGNSLRHPDFKSASTIRDEVLAFIGDDAPEFWGYYSAYDHVVLCQLFGTMMDLPKGWPMYTRDLRQWLDEKGLAHVTQSDDAPHIAIDDARWIAEMFKQYANGALSE